LRFASQSEIQNNGMRQSQAQLLWGGDSGWVVQREGGMQYGLDVTKCMFSSGNVTEKARMGALALAAGETVVDLYAGIGYYTVPLLARANAAFVYACEWNPDAVHALRHNLKVRPVCTVSSLASPRPQRQQCCLYPRALVEST